MPFWHLPVEKQLYVRPLIPKNQIDTIKNVILHEGYVRITRDNYSYKGSFVTQYQKEILVGNITRKVTVRLQFYNTKIPSDYYGMAIQIFNNELTDSPEDNKEVIRMEQILYKKLIEIISENNVVRRDR